MALEEPLGALRPWQRESQGVFDVMLWLAVYGYSMSPAVLVLLLCQALVC